MGFLDKLKGKVNGKGKGKKKKVTDKKSVEERYGISESSFHNNPLYEADTTEDHYGVEPAAEQVAEPAVEPAAHGNIKLGKTMLMQDFAEYGALFEG